MSSRPPIFTATRAQIATYLLSVCPFSIAFLVFLNSSVSFVVTDLIGLEKGVGDAVGTLGFADELLALIACPVWGLLSDRIGVRHVCAAGYAIIALALVLSVQSSNVYPQLLLGRLLFSLGGSAVSTMVTAVLPAVTANQAVSEGAVSGSSSGLSQNNSSISVRRHTPSMSSEVTITPIRFERSSTRRTKPATPDAQRSSPRLAGFVGMFAGCGALIALVLFLPLPARFERSGASPASAITRTYYIVGAVALAIAVICFIGLRNLHGEEGKGWSSVRRSSNLLSSGQSDTPPRDSPLPYSRNQLSRSFYLGFTNPDISLSYIGGFVARSSSVGISLFIPLFVNHYYRESGLCHAAQPGLLARDLGEIKKSCPEAYVLASILTGVSQLVALITAPAYGYLSDKSRRHKLPLHFAALVGVAGYVAFPLLPSPRFRGPDGTFGVFVVMGLLGLSQIGAIVCSLAVLNDGVLNNSDRKMESGAVQGVLQEPSNAPDSETGNPSAEQEPLLGCQARSKVSDLGYMKGSIAGVYSLYGGAGILLLTKLGGLLFDVLSPGAPFYIMALFNGILFVACIGFSVRTYTLRTRELD
ncbi:hypothetical protein Egran_02404 [Elaphomyces granulatus]|uniref:Major facilitator superfamily (MFS) profile domain-containing protein n=1 Tax=Elaphomyces granulatus TaxID=519963 RepID=A0A232M0E8_9EURO|nr:hypothetical protein Egran_02404 [Elaphomyces granulatus]